MQLLCSNCAYCSHLLLFPLTHSLPPVLSTFPLPSYLLSQLSKGKTQCPFTRTPGTVQSLSFHPSRPFLFVATQTAVKVYHLIEQRMVKKLMSGCKWISSIDMHPSGDHVIIGSYDRRCALSPFICPALPCPPLHYPARVHSTTVTYCLCLSHRDSRSNSSHISTIT